MKAMPIDMKARPDDMKEVGNDMKEGRVGILMGNGHCWARPRGTEAARSGLSSERRPEPTGPAHRPMPCGVYPGKRDVVVDRVAKGGGMQWQSCLGCVCAVDN